MEQQQPPYRTLPENHELLAALLAGTASETGTAFFRVLVENVTRALGVAGSWVTEYLPEQNRLRALAFRWKDGWIEGYEYAVPGTPCAPVIDTCDLVHIPERVVDLFPDDPDLPGLDAVSYMGIPFLDEGGGILGHLAVLHTEPFPRDPRAESTFRIFAARAAAELGRMRAETVIREKQEKLSRLVDSAMDAIVEIDPGFRITQFNPAAETTFDCTADRARGRDLATLLEETSAEKLRRVAAELLEDGGPASTWIAGGLVARLRGGDRFPAEATLSRSGTPVRPFLTLILRNVDEKRRAEQRIRALAEEAGYLRDELNALQGSSTLLGESPPMRRVLQEVEEVAPVTAAVLIAGESGTGKELVARAVHRAGPRGERPLITLNCAALPANLVESELFGHERGAFTGATQRREGRFTLADGGTLFLDEVAELPVDLQGKLLRVLQEGEFEPVGSSVTRKVDVRVISATNRDLEVEVQAGRFRQDLFYRLSVFPILVPPLRERGNDVVLLARVFVERIGKRLGRPVEPLSEEDALRLRAYPWPGNVRELQNVIERAIITSREGRLDLDRALPGTGAAARVHPAPRAASGDDRIRSVEEFRELERENLLRALDRAGWTVSGKDGAAALLGMKPTTLASRMKALGIKRPSSP